MRILIGCEYSGAVRDAFRKRGYDAWSCDIINCDGDPTYHIVNNVLEVVTSFKWNVFICHPPCTYLTNAGVRWLFGRGKAGAIDSVRWDKMVAGADFFLNCLNAPVESVCIENPIMHKHAKGIVQVNHTQTIQPWQFGHEETKATCLWLKGLPPLVPTKLTWSNYGRVHEMGPSADRSKERARTLNGIANAMADQWGPWLKRLS